MSIRKVYATWASMTSKRRISAFTFMLLLGGISAAQQKGAAQRNLVGTWKLNPDKSIWGAIPAPKEDTLLVTQDDAAGLKWMASGVSAEGEAFNFSFSGAADGKDYPLDSSNKEVVAGYTRSYTRTGESLKAVDKKHGRVIQRSTTTISKDGRTMTIRFTRDSPPLTWTEVLERK